MAGDITMITNKINTKGIHKSVGDRTKNVFTLISDWVSHATGLFTQE